MPAGHPTTTVLIALLGWVPLTVLLFALYPSRRAFLISMVGGWLFLPVCIIKLKAVPEYSKLTAATYGCLLGTAIFDWGKIAGFRFRWFDLPMICWCLTPYVSSIQNDLGWYDGVSAIIQNAVLWGAPYFLGRIYFRDWESFRELGIAIVIGGILYIPLCLIEIRLSPQLHRMVYGFSQGSFSETHRMGGYRPMVFLQHGLAVGMWMTSASLCALWLWQSKSVKQLLGLPILCWVVALIMTTVLCKSLAGLGFLCAGIGILYSVKLTKLPILFIPVILVAPTYMFVRTYSISHHVDEIQESIGQPHAVGEPLGEEAVAICLKLFGEERTQSFETRVRSENQLAARALEQPWFGWGRWNRNRVHDKMGKDAAPTDGLWVIALGVSGIVGLCAFTLTMLLPPLLVWYRCPMKLWDHPGVAAAVAMAVLLSLYMCDNILNAMPDPIFTLALGGLAGIAPSIRAQLKNPRPVMRPAAAMPAMAGFSGAGNPRPMV
jgi:hypothetical protein